MGNDPEHYDFSGADFHMIEDWNPRTTQGVYANASACPPTSGPTCDPINGREWTTNKGDLQFSCVFNLKPQYNNVGKDCTDPKYTNACDCAANALNSGTQLCSTTTPTLQVFGKAYPSVRKMIIAKAMSESSAGNQGIVSSLCPIHVTAGAGGQSGDPLYGYNPAVNAIINRLKNSLSNPCLPQKLVPDSSSAVPCLILVGLSAQVGAGACSNPGSACNAAQGLLGPGVVPPGANSATLSQDILNKYCQAQEAGYKGTKGAPGDPDTYPVCALAQLTPTNNPTDFAAGSCSASKDPGWCYVEGKAAGTCPQAILFSNGEPPTGATVSLQCIEQAVAAVNADGGGGGGGGGGRSTAVARYLGEKTPRSREGIAAFLITDGATDAGAKLAPAGMRLAPAGMKLAPAGMRLAPAGMKLAPAGMKLAPAGMRLAPAGMRLAPAGMKLAPAGMRLAPAGMRLAPAGMRLAPAGMRLAPAGMRLAPAGMRLAPAGMKLAPAGMRLAPAGMRLAPAGMKLAPAGMKLAPAGMSPLPAGARFMTAGTRLAGHPVRPTCASVRLAPSSAPLVPGPDESGPASVPSSGASIPPSGARVEQGRTRRRRLISTARHDAWRWGSWPQSEV